MVGSNYGYVRVSTREPNENRQFIALEALAIPKRKLFIDKQSGKITGAAAARQCGMPLSTFRLV